MKCWAIRHQDQEASFLLTRIFLVFTEEDMEEQVFGGQGMVGPMLVLFKGQGSRY
eukprot:GAHX01002840.1.p2 GENE.GAHX01002840.1~~GAHX01002840.1.p2  ORF type:complete len:55 (+),score=2.60 GAHX01002840.1:224-388(+)